MPRLRPDQNPAYRLHKPSGRAVVSIDGRAFYLGEYGTTESRQRYDEIIGQWRLRQRTLTGDEAARLAQARATTAAADAARQIGETPQTLTVAEAMGAYLRHATAEYNRNPRSAVSNIDRTKASLRHVNAMYGATPVTLFGPLALMNVREKFVADGITRKYVNILTRGVQRAFKWLAQRELVPVTVYQALKTVEGLRAGRTAATESVPVRPVPEAFVDATVAAATPTVAAMIRVQALTGMRSGELVIMRPRDIDMSGAIWEYVPERHKTEEYGHRRKVFLNAAAQEIVRPLLTLDRAAYLFAPSNAATEKARMRRAARKTKVQPSQHNRRKAHPSKKPTARYTTTTYYRAVQYAADRANQLAVAAAVKSGREVKPDERIIPRWHPHRLRHNYATRVRREFGIEAARIVLGHASTRMTEVYAERDEGIARNVVAKLGAAS